MENATKALLMAGGVLLGILIIGILVLMARTIAGIPEQKEKVKEAEQIATFNKLFESYQKSKLRGTEVVSVINRAIDNNLKYANDDNMKITVKVEIKNDIPGSATVSDGFRAHNVYDFTKHYNNDRSPCYFIITGVNSDDPVIKENSIARRHTFMYERFFEFKEMQYNNLGRVSEITFTEKI